MLRYILFALFGLMLCSSGSFSCAYPIPPLYEGELARESIYRIEMFVETVKEESRQLESRQESTSMEPLKEVSFSDASSPDWPECQPGQEKKCYTGLIGTEGVGACRAGMKICDERGEWGACLGEVLPTKEICNAEDDDCNGQVDEPCPCVPGSKKKCGYARGECVQGEAICKSDGSGWGDCVGAVAPKEEECNGKDDDCDGFDDENVSRFCYTGPAGTKDVGECFAGVQYCSGGVWFPCEKQGLPEKELCNEKDDDCDGSIDEDFVSKGGVCGVGVGACRRQGRWVCSSVGSLRCDGVSGKPVAEVCDGVDNDCDGKIDVRSCYPQSANGCSMKNGKWMCLGACQTGTQVCKQGVWDVVCNVPKRPAKVDACGDKVDNDCDGKVDEGCCAISKKLYQWKKLGDLNPGVAFAPDLKFLVSTGFQKQNLYSIDGVLQKAIPTATTQQYNKAAYHPNGKDLIVFGKTQLEIIDIATGISKRKTPHGKTQILLVDVDDTGTFAITMQSIPRDKLIVWRLADLKEVLALESKNDPSVCLRLSRAGDLAVTCGYTSKTVKVWSVPSGKLLHTIYNTERTSGVDFSPDGSTLVFHNPKEDASQMKSLEFYDLVHSKRLPGVIKGYFSSFPHIRYSPNGKWIAAVGTSGKTGIFDVASRKKVFQTPIHINLWGVNGGRLNGRWSRDGERFSMGEVSMGISVWGCK